MIFRKLKEQLKGTEHYQEDDMKDKDYAQHVKVVSDLHDFYERMEQDQLVGEELAVAKILESMPEENAGCKRAVNILYDHFGSVTS